MRNLLLLAGFLCLPTAHELRAETPKVGTTVVAISTSNVYEAVGGGSQIDQLHAGVVVRVRGIQGEWVQVADGVLGWAKAEKFLPVDRSAAQRFDAAVARSPTSPRAYCARGLLRWRLHNAEGATSDFRRALKLDPTYARAHQGLGDLAFDAKEYEEAIRAYGEALLDDNTLFLVHNNRGAAYERTERLEDALTDYTTATRKNPHYTKGYSNAAWVRHLQGNDEVAITLLRKAIDTDPRNLDAHLATGRIYAEIGHHRRAANAFGRCLRINPDRWDLYRLRAKSLFELSERDAAVKDVNRALELKPDDVFCLTMRGWSRLDQGALDEAQDDLREAVRIDPTNAAAHAILGTIEHGLGETELGMKRVRQAVQLDATDQVAQLMLARLMTTEGDAGQSIVSLNAAVQANPDSPVAYLARATAHFQSRRMEETIADANAVLLLNPKASEAYNLRGLAHAALNLHQNAVQDYTLAIENDPKHVMGYCNRAASLIPLLMLDEALRDVRSALRINPKSALAYRLKGDVHAAKREVNSARRAYDRSLSLDPHVAFGYENRARLYASTGAFDKAVADAQQLVAQDEGNLNAWRLLLTIYRLAGDTSESHATVGELAERFPSDEETWIRERALIEIDRNNFPNAAVALGELASIGEGSAVDGYLLAMTTELGGQRQVAITLYESLTRRFPEVWEPWLRLAQIEIEDEGSPDRVYDLALEACRRSQFSAPEALAVLAAAHSLQGDRETAARRQRQAIARLPITAPIEQRQRFAQRLSDYTKNP